MLVSLSWLKEYVEISAEPRTLADDLTMTGLNVEQLIERGYSDPNVVVGKVLEVAIHPNADKLKLCRVQVGPKTTNEVVCGAPNVAAGQTVLVALPGATLPDGTKIRSAKIRGSRSDGMICSEIELGLGDDAAGIMVLEDEHEMGAPISDVLPPPDHILEIEVMPNRPDLLSHVGVAREVAAAYGVPLKHPGQGLDGVGDTGAADFRVEIADATDCARYVGKRVSGVRVGPSPAWLANALESVGLHSVNNVVDATNYVMMELGQPMHAFDFKTLRGSHIVVRRAEAGERLRALDDKTHELDGDILTIADARDPVALAGVIGGEETAVHNDTVEILIESANFHPTLVRSARKGLNIPTDASYRFERGVDRELCRVAAERAADLVCQVAGGKPGPVQDVYPDRHTPITLAVRRSATRRLLGADLTCKEIEGLLVRLGFAAHERTPAEVSVEVPSHRLDIGEEADLIEEVGRLHGYDRIGRGWAYRCSTFATNDPYDDFVNAVSSHLSSRGFNEVITTSFTDGKEITDFEWDDGDPRKSPIPIRNPLNVNHRYLRTSLIPGMLDVVRRNFDYGVRRVDMYQIGTVFLSPRGRNQLPDEQHVLSIVLSRSDTTDFWNNSKQSADLFDIKEEIELLFQVIRIDLGRDIAYNSDEATGKFAYALKNKVLIEGGIVSEAIASRYDFEQGVWCASLDIDELYRRSSAKRKFSALPEYPSSKRDLSLVAKRGIHFEEIQKSLVKSAGPLLESLQVFDVYSGENLASDQTAYGVRLNFRSLKRTLTDGDVDAVIKKVLLNLKKQLDVELRS
jgi:phenylalanyl-tRNA synthetase beta chain